MSSSEGAAVGGAEVARGSSSSPPRSRVIEVSAKGTIVWQTASEQPLFAERLKVAGVELPMAMFEGD